MTPDSCRLFGTPDHLGGPTPKSKIALTAKRGMVLPSIGRTFLIICVADVGLFNQVVVSGKMGKWEQVGFEGKECDAIIIYMLNYLTFHKNHMHPLALSH